MPTPELDSFLFYGSREGHPCIGQKAHPKQADTDKEDRGAFHFF